MRCRNLTIIFLLCGLAGIAQTRIASLKTNIAEAKDGATKLSAVMALCNEWDSFNKDTLHRYAMMADNLAAIQKNTASKIYAGYYLTAWLLEEGRLDTALNKVDALIAEAKEKLPFGDIYVRLYRLRSNILSRGVHANELAANSFELLKLAEANKDTVGMISAKTSIGNANLRMEKYDEAIRWHLQALDLMKNPYYKRKMSLVYSNIAIAYDDLSKNDSAEYYLKQAIQYSRENNNLTDQSIAWAIFSNVISSEGRIKEAEEALKQSVQLQQQIGDNYYTIAGMDGLAKFYMRNKQYEKGIAQFLAALNMSARNRNPFAQNVILYQDLANAYALTNDYKQANEYMAKEIEAMDSTYKNNSATALAEMQAKYETQKKETTIVQQEYQLSKERTFRYAILVSALILAASFVALAIYRRNQQQQKMKQLVEKAKEEERNRIIADLHDDVGGGLSTIRMVSDLIAEQENQAIQLEQYAKKISGITREVTQRMNTIVWALNSENDRFQNLLEYIRDYGFRFFEDTNISFRCDLTESVSDAQLSGLRRKNIFLCVKEALNNIYKHAEAKNAWISILLADGMLTLSINDDGKGINNQNEFGNGLKNIEKRMKEINGTVSFETIGHTSIRLNAPTL